MLPVPLERQLLDSISEAVVTLDAQYVITYWNRGAELLLGWRAEEAVGYRVRAVDLVKMSEPDQADLRECVEAGRPWQGELALRRRGGGVVRIEVSVGVARGEHGEPLGIIVIGRAARIYSGSTLGLSPVSSVVRGCSDGIVATDETGRVLIWNPAAERIFGWTASEALRHPVYELLPLERLAPAALASSGHWRGEVEVPDRDGRLLSLDIEVRPVADLAVGDSGPMGGYLIFCRDLTALTRAARALATSETSLRESEERFRNLVEQKQLGVYLVQNDRFQYVNPKFAEIVGYERAEILALPHFVELVHPEDHDHVRERQRQRLSGESNSPYSFRLRRKNGELAHVEVYGTRTQYRGSPSIIGSLVDITERTRDQAALRESEERYRALVNALAEGILLIDRQLRVITCNESAARLLGLNAKQRSGALNLGETLSLYRQSMAPLPSEEWPGLVTLRSGVPLHNVVIGVAHPGRPGPEITWLSLNTQPLCRTGEQQPYAVVVSAVDITDRKHIEEELHRQAFYDKLTGLPNRALFQDRVERALTQARRYEQLVAVCFIDLDGFKQINDALGHTIGDVFLQQVAQRLSRCLREGDTVARLGGDEFTLLLPALTDAQDAVRVADRVLTVLRQPFYVGPHLLRVTASVGISISPHDGVEVADLLKHADAAMYRVKSAGKDGYQLFTSEVGTAAAHLLNLESQLWLALRDKQLRPCLQPIIDLSTGELRGIDASPRWLHPSEGLIAPRELLALSEDVELMVGLMRWTLRQGCLHMQALAAAGLSAQFCLICVPPHMLMRRELCMDVGKALAESGLPPKRLVLVLQLDRHTVEVADLVDLAMELERLGVLVVLGGLWDAGLPLQYVHALPLTALRLESRFIHRLGSDPKALGLCEGLASLSHCLGLKLIAEGVDTAAQLAMVRRLGCDLACGAGLGWPRGTEPSQAPLLESLQREGGMLACL